MGSCLALLEGREALPDLGVGQALHVAEVSSAQLRDDVDPEP